MSHKSLLGATVLSFGDRNGQLFITIRGVLEAETGGYWLQEKWDETEEKPAVVAITISAFIAIWAASGVVDAVDKLPVIGGLLELVGLLVTGWFAYRYLIFGPDRCVCPSLESCSKIIFTKQHNGVNKQVKKMPMLRQHLYI